MEHPRISPLIQRRYAATQWRYSGGVVLAGSLTLMAAAGGYLLWLTRRTHHHG